MFTQKIKPIFITRIYFEEGTVDLQTVEKITRSYVDTLGAELNKNYHVIVVPIFTTKHNEEPSFETHYPSDFKEIDLETLKTQFNEAIKNIKKQFEKDKIDG